MPLAGREVPRVELLRRGPVEGLRATAPLVAHVELHAAGLVEVVEGDLVAGGGFVHGLAAESARFSGETIKNVFTNIS